MNLKKIFGINVKSRRINMKLSQEKLAEFTNCHRNYIGMIEKGLQSVSLFKALEISEALNCNIYDLLSDKIDIDELEKEVTKRIK